MEYINIFGLVIVIVIMIPNIIFAIKCKDDFENNFNNCFIKVVEAIGRYGCMAFMIIKIHGTIFDWWPKEILIVYLIVNGILVLSYCIIWIFCFKDSSLFKSLSLSIIPSVIFLFSGIMSGSILLILSAILFCPAHIWIFYKNYSYVNKAKVD